MVVRLLFPSESIFFSKLLASEVALNEWHFQVLYILGLRIRCCHFQRQLLAPLTKGQVSYKRRVIVKVSCSKPYAWFFSGAIDTGSSVSWELLLTGLTQKSLPFSSFVEGISYVRYCVENWAYKHNETVYPLSLRALTVLWKSFNFTQFFNSDFSLCSNWAKVLNTFSFVSLSLPLVLLPWKHLF